ncbi:uncharacterized protein LOC105690100 [Athalia rosae]|uniref:uncharacterized protein LOC105690100 n=1 Tax=Athalia rosae TaxID=37344 RepID=UPI002034703D|nr:uncharacterized protein LOC105690100 [Athalia rosae]XP_048507855.1 uncharacterized protein LOC105690100 [Athalia rosae]
MPLEENNDSGDILQPIPFEEWPLLQNYFKDDWPTYSHYYYWIDNSIKWKKLSPNLDLQIYSIQGDYQLDGTFVGISNISTPMLWVFTTDKSEEKFREALIKSNRLDWSKHITFCAVHEHVIPILNLALDYLKLNRGIEKALDIPGRFRFKSANDAVKVEVRVPDDCYLGKLNLSHVPIINSLWPHTNKENPESSMKYFRAIVMWNKGLGLFLKEGDVLVSWALQSDWYGFLALQTRDEYQGRGYAKVIINALAKELGEEGIDPILSIVDGNTRSAHVFDSLGWKPTNGSTWITTKALP